MSRWAWQGRQGTPGQEAIGSARAQADAGVPRWDSFLREAELSSSGLPAAQMRPPDSPPQLGEWSMDFYLHGNSPRSI